MQRSLDQLVRTQILFREVNERVRATVDAFDGPIEFLCECSKESCIETIPLATEEYERVRSHANLFLVTPGHENRDVDRVVDQGDAFLLVKKIVDVDEVTSTDPRATGG